MKPLEKLLNVEKGRLLHQLFPQEIPALVEFVEGMCIATKEQEALHRKQWDNSIFSFDFWLSQINTVQNSIQQYGKKLHKNSRLFADQLFDGYPAMFMVHCMTVYTTTKKHPNRKFVTAIDLLFNP